MADGDYRPATLDEVRRLRSELNLHRKKLVFTNGCFDLLHAGHVRYLKQARALGDALVVAVNSDASVRALKGPSRPIQSQDDRAEILAALRSVDAVIVFDDERVTKLIEEIRPHVYAKGGDYTVESLNEEEREALEFVRADIKILPLVQGRSTTATVNRLLGGTAPAKDEPSGPSPGSGLRLAVLGSGKGSNFSAILTAIKRGELNATVAVAVSDVQDSGVLKLAESAGVPSVFVDPGPEAHKLAKTAQKEIHDHLKRHRVDVVVLVGFMRVLKNPVLSSFKDRIVNVHPSLLPRFKGLDAPQQAIDDGEIETGCTVHLVDEELDGGRILEQATVPIHIRDTAVTLHERIKEQEHKLLPKVLNEWRERGLPVWPEGKK